MTQWRTTPVVFDMNQDGMPDLCMLDTEGYFVLFERSIKGGKRILLPPTRVFCDPAGKPLRFNDRIAGASGRRKIALIDWNGDGQTDLLLNSSNADLYVGLGNKEGKWLFEKRELLPSKISKAMMSALRRLILMGMALRIFLVGRKMAVFTG